MYDRSFFLANHAAITIQTLQAIDSSLRTPAINALRASMRQIAEGRDMAPTQALQVHFDALMVLDDDSASLERFKVAGDGAMFKASEALFTWLVWHEGVGIQVVQDSEEGLRPNEAVADE